MICFKRAHFCDGEGKEAWERAKLFVAAYCEYRSCSHQLHSSPRLVFSRRGCGVVVVCWLVVLEVFFFFPWFRKVYCEFIFFLVFKLITMRRAGSGSTATGFFNNLLESRYVSVLYDSCMSRCYRCRLFFFLWCRPASYTFRDLYWWCGRCAGDFWSSHWQYWAIPILCQECWRCTGDIGDVFNIFGVHTGGAELVCWWQVHEIFLVFQRVHTGELRVFPIFRCGPEMVMST